MAWQDLSLPQRIEATHIDIARHKEFTRMSGVAMIGEVKFSDSMPTAATDGRDVIYGNKFCADLNRKQLRYLVLHENGHKLLHHCTEYQGLAKKYPRHMPRAADYVVNGLIEELDPTFQFVERPTNDLLIDRQRFNNMSLVEVLKVLIDEDEQDDQDQQGGGGSLDEHMEGNFDEEEATELKSMVEEAVRQSAILANNMAGQGSRNLAIDNMTAQRNTDWRQAMREFATTVCVGHDLSRLSPPNKRFLPLGVLLWSHFSESTGELVIAGDTSGSMGAIYPVLFGEIANICRMANPERVRIIWWDSEVCGEQVFEPHEYESIAQALKPAGGGGTEPSCVVRHLRTNDIKAKGIIWLTDGYFYGAQDLHTEAPQLWGVVDNERFTPPQGKLVNISSLLEGV
jgi:predicted metal-dependent peptidase